MIRTVVSRRRAPAFTLLEVILALSIGLVLLGALYFLLSSQLRMTQRGRDILEDSTVARAVIHRIQTDIQATLAPLDPRVVPDYAVPPADDMTTEGTTPETETESGTTTEGTTKSTTKTTDSSTMPTVRNTVDFNVGVAGGEDYLILTIARPQRLTGEGFGPESAGLRRILYWVTEGGLARYEITSPTSEEARFTPSDVPNPEKHVIAPEVTKLQLEYFDGQSWPTQWNGYTPQGELGTPTGPPSAVRITISFRRKGLGGTDEEGTSAVQHVIAIPNGNHFPQGDS